MAAVYARRELPAEVTMISSRRRPANRRKHATKSMSGLPPQHFARESHHHRSRHYAAVAERGGKPDNVGAALDRVVASASGRLGEIQGDLGDRVLRLEGGRLMPA